MRKKNIFMLLLALAISTGISASNHYKNNRQPLLQKDYIELPSNLFDYQNNHFKYKVFDKKTSKLRNIRYSDICIITDRNKYLDNYKKIYMTEDKK